MSSSERTDLIESAISDVEVELGKLDQLETSAATSQETIKRLETDLIDLGANRGGIEQKLRASRLTSGTSLLTLERGDLVAINSQIENQTDRIIEVSGRATGLLQELWSDVLAFRRTSVEDLIRRTFDLSHIHIPIVMLASAAHCIIEVQKLDTTLFPFRTRQERDLSVYDARQLRARSAPLRGWAASELLDAADVINPTGGEKELTYV